MYEEMEELKSNLKKWGKSKGKTGTDIYIPKEKLNGAKNGDKVLAKITIWPKSSKNPYGEVEQVLGRPGTNDTEMLSILFNQGIDVAFPAEVLQAAEKIGIELDPLEVAKRTDFRNTTTFTIDPVDARDFDDALSIKKLENGHYEIGVHIADVSYYVTEGSPMDEEALKRSNSVYLVDRVIPMLPEQLSNLACSLRPNEDKFSFSAVFEMDEQGKVYNEWFGKTVIHSNRRFTYEEAQEIIEGKSGDFEKEIHLFDKIAKILRNKRLKNGALNIESEEMRFVLDESGVPTAVKIKTSKASKASKKIIFTFYSYTL
jgi:ribonuclease R